MLFLLGAKAHPIIRVLLGVAMIGAGLGLHMTLLAVSGIFMTAWGGYRWYRHPRTGGASKNGAGR
jgi:hypothetical protein